jgi:hypothetical protein
MPSLVTRAFTAATEAVDRRFGWHRLPTPLGIVTLVGIRLRLREQNLYDTGRRLDLEVPRDGNGRFATARSMDGTYNDLSDPLMGSAGSRFGRNVPLEYTKPEPMPKLLEPNPRKVSRELLARDTFKPATTLNLLAAAWIQFEVHDWVFHGNDTERTPWECELEAGDEWHERPMRIQRTQPDPSYRGNGDTEAATWANADTHWWDASQIYGGDVQFTERLRTGDKGKIRIDELGLVPEELETRDYAGQDGAFWVGLALLHSLFMREHNAICDRLAAEHPSLSDDELFDKARLVNAALMAKIHTLDWTSAIIAHPTTIHALGTNWWGLPGERFAKRFGRRTKSELLRGIPGSPTNHFGVPYALTEEFVAVDRMHPLIPDEYTFRSLDGDGVLQERTFPELNVLEVRNRLAEMPMADVFYSFGVSHPGAITLHNYPRFLREFARADGLTIDLAATDVLRLRERGVPRYNQFRRLFHMKPAETFEDLTDNAEWAEEIRGVYENDIERVDLMVGLFAEPLPKGFGFSDTAFRVFVLMASRRLESDRFFTSDFRPEIYTPAGMQWIDDNTFRTVLLRHFPKLEPALRGVANPFAPWSRVSSRGD